MALNLVPLNSLMALLIWLSPAPMSEITLDSQFTSQEQRAQLLTRLTPLESLLLPSPERRDLRPHGTPLVLTTVMSMRSWQPT